MPVARNMTNASESSNYDDRDAGVTRWLEKDLQHGR